MLESLTKGGPLQSSDLYFDVHTWVWSWNKKLGKLSSYYFVQKYFHSVKKEYLLIICQEHTLKVGWGNNVARTNFGRGD